MAERERRLLGAASTPFVAGDPVMDRGDLDRSLYRMAHEILERDGADGLALVGLQTGGVDLAERLAAIIGEATGSEAPPLGVLDVALHRDDVGLRPVVAPAPTRIPFDVSGRTVVLVDDVLFTGRTVRAALDALTGFGRPRVVRLAVMIDRGHRELPIRPDFVGRNLPTSRSQLVSVDPDGVRIGGTTGGAP